MSLLLNSLIVSEPTSKFYNQKINILIGSDGIIKKIQSLDNKVYDFLLKKKFLLKAMSYITSYDISINNYFQNLWKDDSDENHIFRKYTEKHTLKYGCNPYQDKAMIFSVNNNKLPFKIINGNLAIKVAKKLPGW